MKKIDWRDDFDQRNWAIENMVKILKKQLPSEKYQITTEACVDPRYYFMHTDILISDANGVPLLPIDSITMESYEFTLIVKARVYRWCGFKHMIVLFGGDHMVMSGKPDSPCMVTQGIIVSNCWQSSADELEQCKTREEVYERIRNYVPPLLVCEEIPEMQVDTREVFPW